MRPQTPGGNTQVVVILSVLLVIMTILLFVLFFLHLSFKRRMIKKLSETSSELEKRTANYGIFTSNLSREIRSHMVSIMGNDEIILRESLDNSVRNHASKIRSSSENVMSLMQGVMDFMRIGAGNIEYIKKEYDLSYLIIDVFTSISPNFKNRELVLNVTADRNCPRNLVGDYDKVKSSLLNLFSFIGKNLDKNGITDFEVGFAKNHDSKYSIDFNLICTGLSVENNKIETCILQSPAENKYNSSKNDQGFLELFLSGAIIHFMKSKLEFSERGDGKKVFSFSLPVEVSSEEEIIGDIRDIGHENGVRNYGKFRKILVYGARLLMVDDSEENRNYFKNILESVGCSVASVSDAEEALSYIRKEEFDMIFIRDGVKDDKDCEIIKRIRGGQVNPFNAHKPCIAICYDTVNTGNDDSNFKFDDAIVVPTEPGKIEDVLVKYLPKEKYEITHDSGVYPQIHGIEDIRKYSEGYEDLFRNTLNIYKRASNYRKSDNSQ